MKWFIDLLLKIVDIEFVKGTGEPSSVLPVQDVISDIKTPVEPILSSTAYDFSTQKSSYHSVRVICDEEGLNLAQKNEICATIMGESQFYNDVVNKNKNSKDWGICQINDRFHIGKNLEFPSVEYVVNNPEKVVRWMIKMYKAGFIDWWCAHSNGSYKRYLSTDSPMWLLSK